MSKLKSPQEKKSASLDHDRRNAYFENDKSSRKNIPRSKKLSHQAARKAANQPLQKLRGEVDENQALNAELQARVRGIEKSRTIFNKKPDATLRETLIHRETGKWPSSRR
ncbi:MAG: hypothetical protein WA294_04995 [Acidobacteriaceae bacterium]